jgi:alkaline phosphatase
MTSLKRVAFTLFIFLFISTLVLSAADKPKNIIYLIGDGMGVTQVSATLFEKSPLNFERFKVMGLHRTSSLDDEVTDSAAAGTALATGQKTNNGMLGMAPDGRNFKNLMEYAREKGKATGLVVTVILPHATPAAFSAHTESRKNYNDIALQQATAGFDVLIGGGLTNFYPQSFPKSRRKDDIHVIDILRSQMPVVFKFKHLEKVKGPKFTAILDKGHLPLASKRNYTLGQLTEKALEALSQKEEGFVLMVEGSQIDICGHRNDSDGIIGETLDFDGAIGVALDFAERDGNTLVIVTADHETSGIALHKKSFKNGKVKTPNFATDDHTAAMVPIFTYGPSAENFGGIHGIDEVGQKLIDLVK